MRQAQNIRPTYIRDQEVTGGAVHDIRGIPELCVRRSDPDTALPAASRAGDRVDVARSHPDPPLGGGVGCDLAHDAILRVSDVDVALRIRADALRVVELCCRRRTAVARVTSSPSSGHDPQRSRRLELKDPVGRPPGNEDISGTIDRNRRDEADLRSGRRSASPSSQRVDAAGLHCELELRAASCRHLPNPAVARVGDEHVTGGIDRDTARTAQLRRGAKRALAGESRRTSSGERLRARTVREHGLRRVCRGLRNRRLMRRRVRDTDRRGSHCTVRDESRNAGGDAHDSDDEP